MKTKYLFSAAILASMFAACTNEDLVAPSTDTVSPNDGRPTVSVKLGLDLGDNANTRLIFDGDKGYQFKKGDRIGALLMDEIPASQTLRPKTNPDEWAKLSWLEKYELKDYIHTDYPFDCTEETANGGTTWEANAKMLEGNYFFAYPYEGYDAERQFCHSIINQKQDGGTLNAAMKSYADNQFFIGYAQIKKGNDTKEALTNVSMTSVLGAVRLKLINAGTVDRTITKIVLSGANIASMLKLDPTKAEYTGEGGTVAGTNYNLRTENGDQFTATSTVFNYANYLGLEADDLYKNSQFAAETDYVYNIPAAEKANYKRGNALRKVIGTYAISGQNDKYAELALTDNGAEGIVAKAGSTLDKGMVEVCIMINPITVEKKEDLKLSIYTTDGLIKDIDLSTVNTETDKQLGNTTVITNQAVKNVAPEIKNVIEVQFDNNSVQAPTEAEINNSDDLKQYVKWISTLTTNRLNTAALTNSAAIDAETAVLLNKSNVVLYVKQATNATSAKLQIAKAKDSDNAEAKAALENVLDNIIVDEDCPVEVLGTANIGVETLNHDYTEVLKNVQQSTLTTPFHQGIKLEVAEGGVLNVIGKLLSDNVIATEITNNGTLNVKAEGNISNVKVVNHAKVTVDGTITMAAQSQNELKAEITVSKTGSLSGTTSHNFKNLGTLNNHGKIWNVINDNNNTVKPSTVNIYRDATVSQFNTNQGVIAYDTLGTAISFDQAVTDAIRGKVTYTTKYKSGTSDADKVITTTKVNEFNITDLEITEGTLTSDFGRTATGTASASVAYDATTTSLKALIVNGEGVKINGKTYPLLMGANALIQIDGSVELGTSIIATAFDAKSYITGTVNVTEKVAIASAGNAVYSSTGAFDHSEFTAADWGTIMKGATINVKADKFFAVSAIAGVDKTSNAILAVGTFYVDGTLPTVADNNIEVSGNTNTTMPSPLSDK
ncbi:MAG: hypothetical protein BACD_02319 [Bacteroides rodentium]